MINELSKITVRPDTELREVMVLINGAATQVALVTDNDDVLIGTVTDGDLRRGLLKGLNLNASVSEVMNRAPKTLIEGATERDARKLMRENRVSQIPIIDSKGRVVSIVFSNGPVGQNARSTRVILMAGGLGTRLRPLTEKIPKPMVPIGSEPLLELIIKQLHGQGFGRFTISLNYLGHIISGHFGNGAALGVKIDYIKERNRLGTGGALSLLTQRPEEPFIVMNADILTTTSLSEMMEFHNTAGSAVTICARDFNLQVPFGVLNTEGTTLMSMQEKPIHNHLVNAGIYALSPIVFQFIKDNEQLDLPNLIERVRAAGHKVSVFHINEYWIDIGRIEDLDRARAEYATIFNV